MTINTVSSLKSPESGLGQPSRVILEATNCCNLQCKMCLQQSWSEVSGRMSEEVFSRLVSNLREFTSPPEVFFGGYGEPLSHPSILEMIRQVSPLSAGTALITNGTLLTPALVESLIGAGLEKLWISVDSFHLNALLSVGTGDAQPNILDILTAFRQEGNGMLDSLQLGLAFVLTGSNQPILEKLLDQGRTLGIESYFITNLEAYSASMAEDLPYSLSDLRHPASWRGSTSGLDMILEEWEAEKSGVTGMGARTHPHSICPFAERGDLVLRWDGEISPCLPLLYDRTTYIGSWERKQHAHSLGNIMERSLQNIWVEREYVLLRKRLLHKEFSPCLDCQNCWLSEDNRLDCMGFEHPTCGGCLWAEGLINCP